VFNDRLVDLELKLRDDYKGIYQQKDKQIQKFMQEQEERRVKQELKIDSFQFDLEEIKSTVIAE